MADRPADGGSSRSRSRGASGIAKTKLRELAEPHGRTPPDLGRAVARLEAGRKDSDIQPLLDGLKGALLQWRGE